MYFYCGIFYVICRHKSIYFADVFIHRARIQPQRIHVGIHTAIVYHRTPISKENLQPGDLLLFSYYGSDSIGHTGIYIGDGQFIHAANSSRGIVKDTIESGYYLDNYVAARRLY